MNLPSLPRVICLAVVLAAPTSLALADNYSSAVMSSNPVLYYRFQESGTTATNSGSATINGTANSASILGTAFGPLAGDGYAGFQSDNLSANLSGTQWISLGTQNLLIPYLNGASAVTLESWINLSSLPSGSSNFTLFNIPLNGTSGPTAVGLNINSEGDIIMQARAGGSSLVSGTFDTNLSAGQWVYMASVYDFAGDSYSLYINGMLIATTTATFPGNLVIGSTAGVAQTGIGDFKHATNPSAAGYFQGMVDELAVYNYGLSASEINAHYQAAVVPEPSTLLLMGVAVGGLVLARRRRK